MLRYRTSVLVALVVATACASESEHDLGSAPTGGRRGKDGRAGGSGGSGATGGAAKGGSGGTVSSGGATTGGTGGIKDGGAGTGGKAEGGGTCSPTTCPTPAPP